MQQSKVLIYSINQLFLALFFLVITNSSVYTASTFGEGVFPEEIEGKEQIDGDGNHEAFDLEAMNTIKYWEIVAGPSAERMQALLNAAKNKGQMYVRKCLSSDIFAIAGANNEPAIMSLLLEEAQRIIDSEGNTNFIDQVLWCHVSKFNRAPVARNIILHGKATEAKELLRSFMNKYDFKIEARFV